MKTAREIENECLEQDLLEETKRGLENLIDIGWLNASEATNAIFEDIDNALETLKE
jgi:hypothetical protein